MAASKQEAARAKSKTREPGQKIHQIIEAKFGEIVELVDAVDPFTVIKDVDRFLEVMAFLKEHHELKFDFLRSVTGVDWPDEDVIESVYHLYSYDLAHGHTVKYRCYRTQAEVPSVEKLWPVANWFEREVYDLSGIIYLGHSDLRRIMLPDDWVGHPLLKDYVEEADYRGIGTTRASPLDAFKQMDDTRKKAREERGEAAPDVVKSSIEAPPGWISPAEKKKLAAAAKAKAEAEAKAETEAALKVRSEGHVEGPKGPLGTKEESAAAETVVERPEKDAGETVAERPPEKKPTSQPAAFTTPIADAPAGEDE